MDRREDVGEVYPGGGFAGGHGGAIEDIVATLAELSNVSRELAQRIDGKVDKGDFAALELGDGATQKEVRQMLQNVLGKLKGLSACAAAMLSFAAFAIEPDIAWEDMPPTNKVRDVVAEFAPEPGDYATVSNAAMSAAITNALQDAAIAGKADKADLDPLLLAQYYPDGNVTSAAEFTHGIKYAFASTDTERTATVKPFRNTGNTTNDNSALVGRVVVPPFVDGDGNGYISDDGTRYRVVGVSSGTPGSSNANLTAIVAPSTVTTVGDYAFYECTRLVSASFPATISIGGDVFERCGSLVSVSFPSAATIGPSAFTYCGSLASVSLPSAITIKNGAFMYCDSLASVSLPCVQVVEAWAFCSCDSLVSISLPSVTSVANNSFSYCASLKSLDFPVLPNAAANSMQGNVSLEQVSLYAATNIAGGALKYCYSLKSVNFGAKPRAFVPQCKANSFTDVPRDCVFIIPDEQYNAWTAPTIPDPAHDGESIANRWYDLVQAGYKFLRHGEWEYARRADVAAATQYVRAAPIEIPAAAAAKGVTLVCAKPNPDDPSATCGEEDNGAVEIGRNARAAVTAAALNAAPSNTVGRSVGVAIGAEADAVVSDSSVKSQGIAVGWHAQAKASNAIAIGGGAQHTFEDAMSGAAAYANASEAVAVGYSAKATAPGAVQFGRGTNSTDRSFQFREWQVLDGRGQIPAERLADAAEAMTGGMLSQLERLVSPGNMAVMYGGSDDQRIEPRLDGVCDVLMQPDTNGVWMAGAEAYVVPPLGSRNYDLVITNIPQAYRWDRSGEDPTLVPVPEDQNFLFDFSELPRGITPTLRCAASIGYVRGRSVVITNAPLVVRIRQPATNRVVAVAKPWDEWEM